MNGLSTENILLSIGGDFYPDREIGSNFSEFLFKKDNGVKKANGIFTQSDLAVINLESPLTESNGPIVKNGPCFKASPDMIRIVSQLGANLVTLANNHIRDFGDDGIKDTIAACKSQGIDIVGADVSLAKAKQIYYRRTKGRTLAVINVAENEFAGATPTRGGANPLDLISLLSDIREARSHADHVVLIVHGGLEYIHYPSPESVRLLRFLSEQGLTAIIRHHPHYVQGYEVWKGVPIFYSLGNFLCDSLNKSRPGFFEGILVTLTIDDNDQCQFEIHPFEQCKGKSLVRMLEGTEKKLFMERLGQYSTVFEHPVMHRQIWAKILEQRKSSYFGQLVMPNYFLFRAFRKLRLLKHVKPSQRKKLLWENYLRCEAHREALIDILEAHSNPN